MRNKYIYIEIDKDNSVKSYSYTENLSSNFIKFENENLSIHFLNYPIFYKYNSDNDSFIYDANLYNNFNSKHMNESEKDSKKLMILGKQTTQMMLAQSTNQKQTQFLGKSTIQLALENNEFKIQNKTLGNHICNLTLENNELKQQIKSLGHMMIEMQLNK